MHVDARAQDKLERDISLKYHHLNRETKPTSKKGQLLSWVDTSISANRIRHHAPFIVTSNISVSQLSLVTELIIDRSKHALPSNIRSCSLFFTDSYPKSLTIFISRRRRDLSLGHFGDGGGGGRGWVWCYQHCSRPLLPNVREDYIRAGLRIFETGS